MSLYESTMQWFFSDAPIMQRLIEHICLSFAVVAIAAIIALPLGITVGHLQRGEFIIVTLGNLGRALPTLGLITLIGLLVGIGLTAPFVSLVVLAIPPLLAGSYSAIASVDKNVVFASQVQGMTVWQVISKVEIPLGWPVIFGALRSAVIQVVATATLAAYVADIGLGRFIFTGLKTNDYGQMIGGSLIVIALALGMELLFECVALLRSGLGTRR
ncbi:ABC-type proline/glycine betaine transport system, permease component [Corynebacterium kutscheri]|uniref:ABC transporter permease n=1 Tax=Corynebacterium kutscheri TaxID=35755 RepID=A0A0F6TDH6_9CORY|nr:ABC transporter permease subunit [Corynebacterium kutscheri]AKE40899.1 ABC-type proline/glycine betaine transport system, permease component [Corynebacterium kutscheri]VEH06681.1 ABC transporter permease [Corynebacterium kutscheri]VEH09196.1 ABC transporter permease [Corynebacterium kutscheri]